MVPFPDSRSRRFVSKQVAGYLPPDERGVMEERVYNLLDGFSHYQDQLAVLLLYAAQKDPYIDSVLTKFIIESEEHSEQIRGTTDVDGSVRTYEFLSGWNCVLNIRIK